MTDEDVGQRDCTLSADPPAIPPEALDLIRFLCATWVDIDRWAYANAGSDALCKYPVIQGTRNQINLQRIGEQAYDAANIQKAVKWMLESACARD